MNDRPRRRRAPRTQTKPDARGGPSTASLLGIAVLLAAGTAAGCGADLTGPDLATGLVVEVRKSPIHPVGQEGQDNSAPVESARIRIRGVVSGGSMTVVTGADGTVGIQLRAGAYELEVTECPGALVLPAPEAVLVADGALTETLLVCDTGIR